MPHSIMVKLQPEGLGRGNELFPADHSAVAAGAADDDLLPALRVWPERRRWHSKLERQHPTLVRIRGCLVPEIAEAPAMKATYFTVG
jgi:hypothetical protein